MPRTRTKYLWPPPNSMTAPEEPAEPDSLEPHPKRTRTSREHSPHHESADKSSDGSSLAQSSNRLPPTELAAPNLVARVEYNPLAKSPIEQIRDFQKWRNQGSQHDDFCYACQQQMSEVMRLTPCYTCRVSFHNKCIPPGSTYDQHNHWFCPVCVKRNWHVEPPTMTPPASPPLGLQDVPIALTLQDHSSEHLSTLSGRGSPRLGGSGSQGSQQALSILAEISRSMPRDSPSRSSESGITPTSGIAPHYVVASPTPLNHAVSTAAAAVATATSAASRQSNPPNILSPTPSNTQKFSFVDSHARKSRFATLSSEVDSALWVLYRELESATSLRQHITDLEAEVVKLRQDVSIRDNQLILSQRMGLQASRSLQQSEIDRLKAVAAKNESAVREAEELRAKNIALELEVKKAKEEVASMHETLKEWKGKLINMIGS